MGKVSNTENGLNFPFKCKHVKTNYFTDLTTGVHTSVVDDLADLVSATVSVLLALHLGAAQGLVGVADVFLQTLALRPVVDY